MGSIPDRVIPKTLKMVPVASLLGAQHYEMPIMLVTNVHPDLMFKANSPSGGMYINYIQPSWSCRHK